ncbi:MAG: hypothetical protein AAFW00_27965 [Bacteroidota bacterium]
MPEESIWIVSRETIADSASDGEKGWGQKVTQKASSILSSHPVSPEKVLEEWSKALRFIGKLIEQADNQVGSEFDMQLDEVTMSVEVDSKGKVSLIGTCTGEARGKGGIVLKFKKSHPSAS